MLDAEELPSRAADHEALTDALRRLPWLPYRRGFGLETDAVVRGAQATLDGVATRGPGEGRVVMVRRGDDVVAAMSLARQPFDSDVFGVPMVSTVLAFVGEREGDVAKGAADALLDAGGAICREWGAHHWAFRVSADDLALTQAAIRKGWFLADSTLDFTWDVRRPETRQGACTPDVVVRHGGPEDAEAISRMAFSAYTGAIRTRYATDPWLPVEGAGRLYARWAENACAGTFAHAVAVAEVEGKIVGFDMLKLNATLSEALGVGFGHKGIAAVDPAARGKGITSCMEAFLNRWQHDGGGRFNTGRVLINNIPMQHALAKVGGVVTSALHTFHAWVGPTPPVPKAGAGA